MGSTMQRDITMANEKARAWMFIAIFVVGFGLSLEGTWGTGGDKERFYEQIMKIEGEDQRIVCGFCWGLFFLNADIMGWKRIE
jgi:hypothetical protein